MADASLSFELVKCRLTLFYDYWPMIEVNDETFKLTLFSLEDQIELVCFKVCCCCRYWRLYYLRV